MGSGTQLKTLSLLLTISPKCVFAHHRPFDVQNVLLNFFCSMEAENYRITGVPGPTKVLFPGAEPELQWQSLDEQMFTPHYICLSRRAD